MSRATPAMRAFAERLVAYEARGNKSSGTRATEAFLVAEKMRPHLATLMGNAGFHALLSRALVLGAAQAPWLGAIRVNADGFFEGLDEQGAPVVPEKMVEGGGLVLAQLLGLLAAFIGETLTLRLVREIWPKVPLDDPGFGNGDGK
ncbi:MAG TPA: hypothetical protein VII49_07555 [Rhizomicrobium sp.]